MIIRPHTHPAPVLRRLAKDEATPVAVDVDLVAEPDAGGGREGTMLALVTTTTTPASPAYGKLVKSAEVVHKFAANQFLQAYPNANATITGGFVLYGAADTWQKLQAGKIDAVDATLSLAKAGADVASILADTGVLPINPVVAKGVAATCAAVLLVKEFIDSTGETERTVICVLDPDDLARLPGNIAADLAQPSLALTAAALGTGEAMPAALPGLADAIGLPAPVPSLAPTLAEPVEQLLRRAVSRMPPVGG